MVELKKLYNNFFNKYNYFELIMYIKYYKIF